MHDEMHELGELGELYNGGQQGLGGDRDAVERPQPIPAAEAGARCVGGWIAPDGRFYHAPQYHHIRVGHELRATGSGPTDPWNMRDGWCMVRADGEALILPGRLTQPQLDALGDMLIAAPDGLYRSALLASLRRIREWEPCRR